MAKTAERSQKGKFTGTQAKGHVITVYDYLDKHGNFICQKLRYIPKSFGWRRPKPSNLPPDLAEPPDKRADPNDPSDNLLYWEPNLKNTTVPLFHAEQWAKASKQDFQIIVESEEDVMILEDFGYVATCMGTGEWQPEDKEDCRGRLVSIICDLDETGERKGLKLATSLHGITKETRLISLDSDLPQGTDVRKLVKKHNFTAKDFLDRIDKTPAFVPKETGSRIIVKRLSDVEPVPVQWLWFPRFALGKVSLLVGNPGVGKSFMSLDMAARISTGALWPDNDNLPDDANRAQKGSCLLLTAEDGLADTVRPRLDKMEADCSRVFAIQGSFWESEKESSDFPSEDETCRPDFFNLLRDVDLLENKVKQLGDVKLIIIDPLDAYYGTRADTHQNALVRAVLGSLAELAERQCVCIIGISHLRKSSADLAMYRVMGSIGQIAHARTAWVIQPDKENKDRRRLLCLKNNLCREQPGLAFQINDGRVEYESGVITETADEAFEDESNQGPSVQVAIEFLDEYFAREPEPLAIEIRKAAYKSGISNRTLERAKAKMEIESKQYPYGWRWKKIDQKPE
ncbi:hypothetical protein ES705_20507 [subsurface metagenome]